MNRIRPVFACAAALAAVASLSACSDIASEAAAGPEHGQPGHVMLSAATAAGVGAVVTDVEGKTLYRFDKDLSQPPTSNCDAECAAAWPPVLAGTGSPMLKGIQDTQVTTLTRKDGSKQLALNGWPLYGFAGDKEAGQANGQGVNGTWFAVAPDGSKITTGGQAQPAAGGSGY
jgi:predicted lipoprotein with Yx(FWY)xxD motif